MFIPILGTKIKQLHKKKKKKYDNNILGQCYSLVFKFNQLCNEYFRGKNEKKKKLLHVKIKNLENFCFFFFLSLPSHNSKYYSFANRLIVRFLK